MPPAPAPVGRSQAIVIANVGEENRLEDSLLSSGSVKKVYALRVLGLLEHIDNGEQHANSQQTV